MDARNKCGHDEYGLGNCVWFGAMIIPLYDGNPRHRIPFQWVTVLLIGVCGVAFLYQLTLSSDGEGLLYCRLGMIPADLFNVYELPAMCEVVPDYVTLLTSAFLHADWWHLLGNMLFLWVFGDNVEDAMGHVPFIVFYVVCAGLSALAHGLIDTDSLSPLIGASGAISGVMGAYLMLHPRKGVWVLILMRVPFKLPAWIALGAWFGYQIFNAVFLATDYDATAWVAHIAGFVAGAALIIPMRHKSVPLFDGKR